MKRILMNAATVVFATVALLGFSGSASAGPILDVTVDSLLLSYTGTTFHAASDPANSSVVSDNVGGPTYFGNFTMDWSGTTATGSFSLVNFSSPFQTLITGSLSNFSAKNQLDAADKLASFLATGSFDPGNAFGFAGPVTLNLSSTNFAFTGGVGLADGRGFGVADITGTPVPEPATLTMFGLGSVWLARRRFRRS